MLQAKTPILHYQLSFPNPSTHYVEVTLTIPSQGNTAILCALPVWAPGSYLLREFAKNVEDFKAVSQAGKALETTKVNKNTWKIQAPGAGNIEVTYRVYAFELSVRTSFIDESHAYLNGSSIFMYVKGLEHNSCRLTIHRPDNWKVISTGLPMPVKNDPWIRLAKNYDILADSPLEIGNHEVLLFEAAKIPHQIALYGKPDYNKDKLIADISKIIEAQTTLFGNNPNQNYVFIIHALPKGSGGLEHLNSCTVQVNKETFKNTETYPDFLELIAHEYFHLWNVKRLRPIALGPFNYDAENYTTALWFSEGFTAYYDLLFTRRQGFISPEKYLDRLAKTITKLENSPGNKVQSVSAASFDAWIKLYKPNENSRNTSISYYDKGAMIALLLDLKIRKKSGGEKSLDSLMRDMYEDFYRNKERGFTDLELKASIKKFCGENMDDFFDRYITGTASIPYNDFLETVGLLLSDKNAGKPVVSLGFSAKAVNNQLIITQILRHTPAFAAGLNVNDVLLSVAGLDSLKQLDAFIVGKANQVLEIKVNRAGVIKNFSLKLTPINKSDYQISIDPNASAQSKQIYKNWLNIGN